MKDAYTIAIAMVKYSIERKCSVDYSKLHKMLYYAQCYSLAKYDQLLFYESIKHHDCGPYVEALSRFCGEFGIGEYTEEEMAAVSVPNLSTEEKAAVLFVVTKYGRTAVIVLVSKSKQSQPYTKSAYGDSLSLDSMKEYGIQQFGGSPSRQPRITFEQYVDGISDLIKKSETLQRKIGDHGQSTHRPENRLSSLTAFDKYLTAVRSAQQEINQMINAQEKSSKPKGMKPIYRTSP